MQRGHTVEWRPQGIQLPLQQGEIQSSAAHANQGEADRREWDRMVKDWQGDVGLVIQARFREE